MSGFWCWWSKDSEVLLVPCFYFRCSSQRNHRKSELVEEIEPDKLLRKS